MKFGEKKVIKQKFYAAKKPIKTWDADFVNKDKNYYYYKMILEKCSHHCKKNQLKLGMLILII